MEVDVEEAYAIYQNPPDSPMLASKLSSPRHPSSHLCTNIDRAISQRYSYNLLASGRFIFGKADQPGRVCPSFARSTESLVCHREKCTGHRA